MQLDETVVVWQVQRGRSECLNRLRRLSVRVAVHNSHQANERLTVAWRGKMIGNAKVTQENEMWRSRIVPEKQGQMFRR